MYQDRNSHDTLTAHLYVIIKCRWFGFSFFVRNLFSLPTQMTLLIYLNEDPGGATIFYKKTKQLEKIVLKPPVGSGLIFYHGPHALSPLHESADTIEKVKYVLRSDVMYERVQ
jgi:hypothetical protein